MSIVISDDDQGLVVGKIKVVLIHKDLAVYCIAEKYHGMRLPGCLQSYTDLEFWLGNKRRSKICTEGKYCDVLPVIQLRKLMDAFKQGKKIGQVQGT